MFGTAVVWLSVCGDSSRSIIGWLAGSFWDDLWETMSKREEEGETISLDQGIMRVPSQLASRWARHGSPSKRHIQTRVSETAVRCLPNLGKLVGSTALR